MCSRSFTPHQRHPLGSGKSRSESLPGMDIVPPSRVLILPPPTDISTRPTAIPAKHPPCLPERLRLLRAGGFRAEDRLVADTTLWDGPSHGKRPCPGRPQNHPRSVMNSRERAEAETGALRRIWRGADQATGEPTGSRSAPQAPPRRRHPNALTRKNSKEVGVDLYRTSFGMKRPWVQSERPLAPRVPSHRKGRSRQSLVSVPVSFTYVRDLAYSGSWGHRWASPPE